MKVVIATGLYRPQIGGPATHTKMLEEHLPTHGILPIAVPYSSVHSLPPGIRHIAYALKLLRAVRTADLLFAQDPFSCGLPAAIVARLTSTPFIVRIPGDYAWEQARERYGVADSVEVFQTKKYSFAIELTRTVEYWVVRQANTVVVPSEFMRNIVSTWKPKKLIVINNGTEVSTVDPEVLFDTPYILTASRLVKGKGFESLIAAMAGLPTWKLAIAGAGPLEHTLRSLVKTHGLTDRVSFLGAASPERMQALYKGATVFVLNTEFETFSFQVLESLAAGTATIATTVGAIPEILESGKEGLLISPYDKEALVAGIQSVVQEPQLWEQRKQNAVRKAQAFTSERASTAFAAAFTEAVC